MAILQYIGNHLKGELMEDDNHEETSKAKESALSKDAILLYIQVGLSALLLLTLSESMSQKRLLSTFLLAPLPYCF